MAKYHHRHKRPGWRHKFVISISAGVLTAIVVVIFAVVKFTEGAWLIVILFPVLVFALIRLNREYRSEAQVLERIGDRRAAGLTPRQPNYTRRVVIVFVDDYDLATMAAIRYARSLRPTKVRAVHLVIDSAAAEQLRAAWELEPGLPLDFIDTPDRRVTRAAAELVSSEAAHPGTQVTAILPRRSYSPLISRLLHDRTADKIAGVVSRIPDAAATIIPFDVQNRVRVLESRGAKEAAKRAKAAHVPGLAGQLTAADERAAGGGTAAEGPAKESAALAGTAQRADGDAHGKAAPRPGVTPIGSLSEPGRATVEGRVRVLEIRPVERNSVLVAEISDSTGDVTAMFYGRQNIPGMICGSKVRLRGPVGFRDGRPVMVNPAYELMAPGSGDSGQGSSDTGL